MMNVFLFNSMLFVINLYHVNIYFYTLLHSRARYLVMILVILLMPIFIIYMYA